MRLKSEFLVKGKTWKLEYKWSLKIDGERVRGACDYDTRTIYLDRLLDADEKKLIFLHELIHAAFYETHLGHQTGLPLKTEELVCDVVADVFNDLFDLKWKKK